MTQSKAKAYSYIRFSTPKQEKGSTEWRQSKAAEAYAKENGLTLDSSLDMKDKGISGYTGKNIKEGALGVFLTLVEAGEIVPGSILIIENVDRLSRQPPTVTMPILFSIFEADITLVVMNKYQTVEVTRESYNNNPGIFDQINGEIKRAYYESKRKSELISDAWEKKREDAMNGIPLTRTSPDWCRPVENEKGEHTGFEPVPEVAKVVKVMYRMKAEGKGAARIKNELNKRNDLYKPDNGWAKCTINRYLRSKRVLGQFELHKRDEHGKRKSTGEIVQNYYPQIIPDDLWYKAKAVFDANGKKKGNKGGRNKSENNLFRHINVICQACKKGTMYFDDHGDYKYLRCKNHKRNNGCTESRSVNYQSIFEPLLLRYCHGLNVTDILPSNTKRQREISRLQGELQSVKGKLTELNQAVSNRNTLVNKAESDQMAAFHNETLIELVSSRAETAEKKDSLEAKLTKLSASKKETAERLKNVKELIERLGKVQGDERIDLRIKLRTKLQNLIDKITIGFHTSTEHGKELTVIEIEFTEGVKRTLVVIDGKLDEVITVEAGNVDVQNIAGQRQKESDIKISKALNRAQST